MAKPDENLLKLCDACTKNARDLVEAAKAVQGISRVNIAYHLATLALEELGKRELYQMQAAASAVGDVPPWQVDATTDHQRKLFWCFYSAAAISDVSDPKKFFAIRDSASDIHRTRMAGLYVDQDNKGLNVPSEAVSSDQAKSLVDFAEALVGYAESQKPREDVPEEERALQAWFLNATDDPVMRRRLINPATVAKLRQTNDVATWTRELKAEIEASDQELRLLADNELRIKEQTAGVETKERWKVAIKIETASHLIRPAVLKAWNSKVNWIKLSPQQGAQKKDQLRIEMTLRDDIPLVAVWGAGFTLSLQFLVAINMATSGLWWWPSAPNRRRWYESIRDLKTGYGAELESGDLQVFNQPKVALTEANIQWLNTCFTYLPFFNEPQRGRPFAAYLGGLNFLSLNSIQWRSEAQAFFQFLQSFKLLIVEAHYIQSGETVEQAALRLVNEKHPEFDDPNGFVSLIERFEKGGNTPFVVKIGNAYFMKLLCELLVRDFIIPGIVKLQQSMDQARRAPGAGQS